MRQSLGMGDAPPIGDPLVAGMEQRDDIEAGQQHPVEGSRGGDEILRRTRRLQGRDHGVDRRALRSGEIVRGFLVGAVSSPAHALLVAGRGRGLPQADHHVEIETLAAALVLHLIHRAHPRFDADAAQLPGIIERKPLLVAAGDQNFEG